MTGESIVLAFVAFANLANTTSRPLLFCFQGIFNLPGQVRPMTSYSAEAPPTGALPELHLGSGNDMQNMAGGGAAYARQARRLYVGNITFEATEMNVAQFFNVQMRERGWANDSDAAGVQGPDPVVSVQVNHEKSYAFVEVSSGPPNLFSDVALADTLVLHPSVPKCCGSLCSHGLRWHRLPRPGPQDQTPERLRRH